MPATKLQKYSGDGQRLAVGSLMTNQFTAQALDDSNVPVSGITVSWSVYSVPDGAAVSGLTVDDGVTLLGSIDVDTDINGLSVVGFELGNLAGTYQIRATKTGLTGSPLTFSVVGVPLNAIIDISRAKPYLKIPSTDATLDDLLQTFINNASDAIEAELKHPVNVQNFQDKIYDGNGFQELMLRDVPLIGLLNGQTSDLQYRITPDGSWLDLESDVDFILVDPARVYSLSLYRTIFPTGRANIKLSTKAGYQTVPNRILQVCTEMVVEQFRESAVGEGRLGRSAVSKNYGGGVAGTDRYYELSERHSKMLQPYKFFTI